MHPVHLLLSSFFFIWILLSVAPYAIFSPGLVYLVSLEIGKVLNGYLNEMLGDPGELPQSLKTHIKLSVLLERSDEMYCSAQSLS